MKPINYKVILFLFILFITISSAMSWMPPTHTLQLQIAHSQAPNTPVGRIMTKYPQDVIACDILTDISVFYYFSEGFTSIGKEYKATHSTNLCTKMIELAGNDEQKLACAYGVCNHHVQDTVAHNIFVPDQIKRTGIPNGLIHALSEEKMNDIYTTDEIESLARTALSNKAPLHKEEFRKALVATGSNLPFDSMYDKFVDTVVGNAKYSVGFQAFTAVPASVHVMLILILSLNFAIVIYLLKIKRNIFAKIWMGSSIFGIIFILGLYGLYFTNNLWLAFQTFSTPLTWLIPIPNPDGYMQLAVQNTINLFQQGGLYVNGITDPSGSNALMTADKAGAGVRTVLSIIIIALVGGLAYLSLKKKGK